MLEEGEHLVEDTPGPGPAALQTRPEPAWAATSDRGSPNALAMLRDVSPPGAIFEPGVASSRGGADVAPGALESAREFAIEHRSAGVAALAADAMALVVAAVAAAAVETLLHVHATVHDQSFAFSTTLVRLFVSVPLMALLLAGSRTRWRLRTTVGGQLAATAPALAAGGLISLAGWRLASAADWVQPPASDAVMFMCAIGILTVTVTRLAHHAAPLTTGRRSRRVVIVGSGLVADRVTAQFNSGGDVEVIGFVDDDPADPSRCLGKLRDLASVCESANVSITSSWPSLAPVRRS